MPNLSPNMNLLLPIIGIDSGLVWEQALSADLGILDGHNHTPGSGAQITPDGLNINNDLVYQGNNATLIRSVRFLNQSAPLSSASDIGCTYESGGELYYNDASGNQVQLTLGGSPAGGAGTITGLPSGTASASFQSSSGTFLFQQATSTAANIESASLIIRYPGSYPTFSGNGVGIRAPSGLATSYYLTLPLGLPSATISFVNSAVDGSLFYTTIDNTTLTFTSNILSVKDASIGTSKLIDNAVTKPKLAALGNISSASSGSYSVISSGFYSNITNLSVTITTTGRPVMLMLVNDGSGNPSAVGVQRLSNTANGDVIWQWNRDGSQVRLAHTTASLQIGTVVNTLFPPGFLTAVDTPAAGTHTYILQQQTSDTNTACKCTYCVIFAYEL